MLSPSDFAVLRWTTSSNLTGACAGSAAGFSPLKIRSTYEAARRKMSAVSGPYDISPPSQPNCRKGYITGRGGGRVCGGEPYDHVTLNNNERVCGCDQSTTRILTEVDDSPLDLCRTANRCRHHFDRVRPPRAFERTKVNIIIWRCIRIKH